MKDKTTPQVTIYIYTLSSPYDGIVRYVGVTINPKQRLRDHIKDVKKKSQSHRVHWINSLLRDGVKPIMTIIDETDNENWVQCEIEWIAHYRAMGCKLVNGTDGGEGVMNPSDETRKKMSDSQRKRWAMVSTSLVSDENRKTPSDETRKRMSDAKKGKTPSDETRKRMSDAHRGKKRQPYKKQNSENAHKKNGDSHKKPISQYTKDGTFIRNWDSIVEASITLQIFGSNITECCRGRKRTAGGYVWRYANAPLLLDQSSLS